MKTVHHNGKVYIEAPATYPGTCIGCQIKDGCFLVGKECDQTTRFVELEQPKTPKLEVSKYAVASKALMDALDDPSEYGNDIMRAAKLLQDWLIKKAGE